MRDPEKYSWTDRDNPYRFIRLHGVAAHVLALSRLLARPAMIEVARLCAVAAIVMGCLWLGGADHWAVKAVVALFVVALMAILGSEVRRRRR